MKRKTAIIAALTFAMAAPAAVKATGRDHGSMHTGHGGHMVQMGTVAHQEIAGGVKVTFSVMDMRNHVKGTEIPKGMKDTHHLMVQFVDAQSGKALISGDVKVKIIGPDKSEQVKDLVGMEGHFGADFAMAKKGRYGIMSRFRLAGGKVESSKFWYQVK